MNISLVMIVKNEEQTLRRCLDSVFTLVDEIIIVDTGSTDNTKQIASDYHAKIFEYEWTNDFAAARNFALEQTTSEWSLVLDADEYISNDCADEIYSFITHSPAIGQIKRIDKFMSKDGVSFEQSYISRLFPSSCRYSGKIHEQIVSDLPRVRVDVEIQHDGYFEKKKSDRNIPILLQVIEENPQDPYYYYQIAKEYRGIDEHDKTYASLKQAYSKITHKEGYAPSLIVNFLYAIIASGHLDEGLAIVEAEQDFLSESADFYFVSALFLLELILSDPDQYSDLIPYIERFYLRALEIGETEQEGSVIGTGSFAAHHNLGVYYEVIGDTDKAKQQYLYAKGFDYAPSIERLKLFD
ncbi:glycosyltransferase family 2 protein [Paenibacillus sonchi]|uniref:Glycosyltransferase family 2 protein n=1 Tax=Paenibacillus sonchi TaxID=373687 RepID=A0A974PF91_9BACL|nr:glycosyltransferase family 2 protein [Paenibacillus sonchi]QQZ62197.1 glycosyltransferase family 2 protein [Paenibacillus sonchi]